MLCSCTVLALFTAVGCRDFKDARTPYTPFVKVKFVPKQKENAKLGITSITQQGTNKSQKVSRDQLIHKLPLDPHADSVTYVIKSASPTSPDTLTINYQRVLSLISHERGAQQAFVLKEVHATFARKTKILNRQISTLNGTESDVQIYF